jgi:hypothetical protein
MAMHSILWRRLDRPGHESARLSPRGDGWEMAGAAVFAHEGVAVRLDYVIECDARWRTTSARVLGWVGAKPVRLELAADPAAKWQLNGVPCPAVAGCLDLDLGFSPSTNLLPIRRLALPVGGAAAVRAAWLGFPSLRLEPLDQRYERLGPTTYRYESRGGDFRRDLEVNREGWVTGYPGFWEAEAGA